MDICKHDAYCGGCIHQGVPYEEQLREKEAIVRELMEEKNCLPEKMISIVGSPSQYRYRNKMEYTFGDLEKGGEMTLGMHKRGHYMSIVTVDECQLVHEDYNKVLRGTLEFCRGYSKYHKKAHSGLMRNLILRTGVRTGELLINIVTTSEDGFDEDGFVKMVLSLPLENEVVGILRTINDNVSDAVNCDELRILYGRDYYMEKIMDLDFKVSAFSFFQTNVEAVERLYEEAIDLIDDYENKVVWDLFCGTGTISQSIAKKAKKVVGVELVEEAVEAAKENAASNGLDNCTFIAGDVFKVLSDMEEKPEVIVVDPPRAGINPKALEKIASYGVPEILYISCNPKTLANDLAFLQNFGYRAKVMKPYDNFPMTKHIELVGLITRVKE